MTGVIKGGEIEHRHREGTRCENTQEENSHVTGVMHLQAKECPKLPETMSDAGNSSFLSTFRGVDALISNFWPP